ncbi:hypothetical protein TNCV_1233301 [Trichonephila clavipes]|nr:hypothetical protein TNCV_1233301 [Trichonephila clavipes]
MLVEINTRVSKIDNTESNRGGSVPVIWQNQARRLSGVHPEYSATASVRGSNGEAWAKQNAKGIPRIPFPPYEMPHTATNIVSRETIQRVSKNRQHGVQQGEAVCRSSGKNQARRLSGVHPEYSATASVRGSNG